MRVSLIVPQRKGRKREAAGRRALERLDEYLKIDPVSAETLACADAAVEFQAAVRSAKADVIAVWPPAAGFPPKEIGRLVQSWNDQTDLLVGSRFLRDSIRQRSSHRFGVIFAYLYGACARILGRIALSDAGSGIGLFRKSSALAYLERNAKVKNFGQLASGLCREPGVRKREVGLMWIPKGQP